MDRIIKIYSNEEDLVFDPFCGAGTTAIAALRNKRRYLTVELDKSYIDITRTKLDQIVNNGEYTRTVKSEKVRCIYTKKDLELKAQIYSQELGRKPTIEEFISKFSIKLDELKKLYKDPKNVLKASRIAILNGGIKPMASTNKQLDFL
jgi:16S rRNA G966 N2-methylase RsmD